MLPLAIGLFCPSCLEKTYLPSTWIGPGHLPCVAEAPGAGRSPRGQWCVSISRLSLSVARQWVWENRERSWREWAGNTCLEVLLSGIKHWVSRGGRGTA